MSIDVFENIPIENFRNKKTVGYVKNSQGETGVLYKFEVEEAKKKLLTSKESSYCIEPSKKIKVGNTICLDYPAHPTKNPDEYIDSNGIVWKLIK